MVEKPIRLSVNEIIYSLSTRRELIARAIDKATSPTLREIIAVEKAQFRQQKIGH